MRSAKPQYAGQGRKGRIALVLAVIVGLGFSPVASADESHARELLKAMSDYLDGEQHISFRYDVTLGVVTPDLQKLDFASSGTVSLNRPDKLRITRTGGFADVEMVYDGSVLSVLGKNSNLYAQAEAPGTIDELVDHLRANYGVEVTGADLLLSNVHDTLMDAVVDVKDLGSGVIGGVECNHLAFRTESVDWQIWIAMGDRPYPCRYTITSKLQALAPEYQIDIGEWHTGIQAVARGFEFKPGNATEADITELREIDELPDLTAEGGAQ